MGYTAPKFVFRYLQISETCWLPESDRTNTGPVITNIQFFNAILQRPEKQLNAEHRFCTILWAVEAQYYKNLWEMILSTVVSVCIRWV